MDNMKNTFYKDMEEAKKYEELICEYLKPKFFVYMVSKNDEPHITDGFIISKKTDKIKFFEVKARKPRPFYNDFSIKRNQINRYLELMQNNNRNEEDMLIFVFNKKNHTCYLSNLENLRVFHRIKKLNYPINTGFLLFFNFETLDPIFEYTIENEKIKITKHIRGLDDEE